MTEEDKQLIAAYMGWKLSEWRMIDGSAHVVNPHFFDLNDAGLGVAEMQKRGDDYVKFIKHAYDMAFDDGKMQFHTVTAWLFNAENFFAAMSEWLKERG